MTRESLFSGRSGNQVGQHIASVNTLQQSNVGARAPTAAALNRRPAT